ncbi:hypothetical protein C0J52_03777 [Blattella germanica]|nr:hypothetical protein C0J52_03777 [Blattella germanica]
MRKQQRTVISWFGTNKGRQFSFGIVSIAGIGISAGYFLSHTFLLQKYKEIVQMYGLGVEVPLSSKVRKRLEDVMDDMELSQKERQYIKPFTVFGFDMFHAGCTLTRTGAIIGIPSNFNYEKTTNCNERLQLIGRPLTIRLVLYTLASLFGLGTWMFMQDFTTVYYEAESDKEMAEKGERYIKGGIEFYSKLLQRNIALRTLMGSKGENLYTTTGNNQDLVRRKHLPLTMRKEYFELQLQELKKAQQESSNVVSDQSWKTESDTDIKISSPA